MVLMAVCAGGTVHRAAHLAALAEGGQVLVSQSLYNQLQGSEWGTEKEKRLVHIGHLPEGPTGTV